MPNHYPNQLALLINHTQRQRLHWKRIPKPTNTYWQITLWFIVFNFAAMLSRKIWAKARLCFVWIWFLLVQIIFLSSLFCEKVMKIQYLMIKNNRQNSFLANASYQTTYFATDLFDLIFFYSICFVNCAIHFIVSYVGNCILLSMIELFSI